MDMKCVISMAKKSYLVLKDQMSYLSQVHMNLGGGGNLTNIRDHYEQTIFEKH